MGTSDNSPRRSGNHSLWGQNGAMRVQSQLLENLSWQALSVQRLSEERHKLEERPRVGEEHPFPLSANRRPVIIHQKPRGQGGRRKTDHRWPFVDQAIYYLLVKGPIRPEHQTGRLRTSAETLDEPIMNEAGDGHTLLWWCCRRTELPTGLPTGVLRPSGRTELLEALSGWWRESSDAETKGPRCGVRLWGSATHIRSVW